MTALAGWFFNHTCRYCVSHTRNAPSCRQSRAILASVRSEKIGWTALAGTNVFRTIDTETAIKWTCAVWWTRGVAFFAVNRRSTIIRGCLVSRFADAWKHVFGTFLTGCLTVNTAQRRELKVLICLTILRSHIRNRKVDGYGRKGP